MNTKIIMILAMASTAPLFGSSASQASSSQPIQFTEYEQRMIYATIGGTPRTEEGQQMFRQYYEDRYVRARKKAAGASTNSIASSCSSIAIDSEPQGTSHINEHEFLIKPQIKKYESFMKPRYIIPGIAAVLVIATVWAKNRKNQ